MLPIITTFTGIQFDLQNPTPEMVQIQDIAAALSKLCRFNGHTTSFYSVAQHSVAVSEIVPLEYAFEALLHDAAEAYIGDMTSPLKSMLPEYRRIEEKVETVIRERFGLASKSAIVKEADLKMLKEEQKKLMRACFDSRPSRAFIPWPSHIAEGVFMATFVGLRLA